MTLNTSLVLPLYLFPQFNMFNKELIPIYITKNGYRLEMILSPRDYCLSNINAASERFPIVGADISNYNYTLNDIELNLTYVKPFQLLKQIQFHDIGIDHNRFNKSGDGNVTLQIQIQMYKRIRTLMIIPRYTSQFTINNATISSRWRMNINNLQIRFANEYLFDTPLSSSVTPFTNANNDGIYDVAKIYAECKKAFIHSYNYDTGGSINGANFMQNNYSNPITSSQPGKFLIALDMNKIHYNSRGNNQNLIITFSCQGAGLDSNEKVFDVFIFYHKDYLFEEGKDIISIQ
jgi:hypothetical protein